MNESPTTLRAHGHCGHGYTSCLLAGRDNDVRVECECGWMSSWAGTVRQATVALHGHWADVAEKAEADDLA